MSTPSLICFHDGNCPLCQMEITTMKKLDRSHAIEFVDINRTPERLAEVDLTYTQAMQLLYVVDSQQQLRTGVNAFIALWEQLPIFRHLAAYVSHSPHLFKRLEQGYAWFAGHRLQLTGRKGVSHDD